MQTELFDLMSSYQKSAYDSAKQLMDINTKAMNALMEKQMSVLASCMNHSVEQVELVKDAKDYSSFMSKQAESLKACGEESIETTRETIEILSKTRDEMTKWMESSMQEVAHAAKPVAAAVKKAA